MHHLTEGETMKIWEGAVSLLIALPICLVVGAGMWAGFIWLVVALLRSLGVL
jgi:hypothetical protein